MIRIALYLTLSIFILAHPLFADVPIIQTGPVVDVIDGRTLVISVGTGEIQLRLAGVLAPEPMHPSRRVDELAGKAREWLQLAVKGKIIQAEFIPSADGRDTGGAWVTLQDNEEMSLNQQILIAGLGVTSQESGLDAERTAKLVAAASSGLTTATGLYADDGTLEYLWRGASTGAPLVVFPMAAGRWGIQHGRYVRLRLDRKGLDEVLNRMSRILRGEVPGDIDALLAADGWLENPQNRLDDVSVISWQDVEDRIGMVARVRGQIVSTKNTGKAAYLNFHADWKTHLSVVIFSADFPRFGGDPATLFKDKEVIVTGRVKQYQGRPEIIVSSPEQIEIIQADQ